MAENVFTKLDKKVQADLEAKGLADLLEGKFVVLPEAYLTFIYENSRTGAVAEALSLIAAAGANFVPGLRLAVLVKERIDLEKEILSDEKNIN